MYDVIGSMVKEPPKFLTLYPQEKRQSRIKRCCTGCLSATWKGLVSSCISMRAFTLIMTALLGPFMFYASYNILVAPAVNTLYARLRQTSCVVTNAIVRYGKSNCVWTSCKVGCTDQELYICWNIYVIVDTDLPILAALKGVELTNYSLDAISEFVEQDSELTEVSPTDSLDMYDNMTRLYVTVEGCIYGSCEDWWNEYGRIGLAFPCLVSYNRVLAIPHVDYLSVGLNIFFGLIPLLGGVMSVIFIYIIYCRRGATDKSLSLAPDPVKIQQKWEKAKAKIVQDVMERQTKNGKRKLEPKMIIEIMDTIRKNKGNKITRVETFASAVMTVVIAGDHLSGNSNPNPKLKDFEGLEAETKKNRFGKGFKWRNLALQAKKLHPTVAPMRKFTEVEFDYENSI